jgi:phosphoglucosamine mutase
MVFLLIGDDFMGKFFGTDGVRGVANKELTPEMAFRLGRAGAFVLAKETATPQILVAKDSRKSGDMLEAALTAGLCSIGAEVIQAGVIPSPAVAFLVKKYSLDAGVIISASHNPMQDNGIKFFNKDGFKLHDSVEDEIEKTIDENFQEDNLPRPTGEKIGAVRQCTSAAEDYLSFLLSTVPTLNLNGMKIAIDCANGATSFTAPRVFEKLGAQVLTLHNSPNGININENCGSTHMESLRAHVLEHSADIGLAFDGDGDRMLAVCDAGNYIDGDAILAVCGLDMRERGTLAQNTIVATVMSNQGFEVFCRANEITMHRTDVGDRYVLEKMLADRLNLGGEQAGHIIFLNHSTTGDGILAALQLLSVIARKKKPLSTLVSVVEKFPQILINAKVSSLRKFETTAEIQRLQAEIEAELTDGRILVRPSGTEPLVRVMIEGRDKEKITAQAKKLADTIERCLV